MKRERLYTFAVSAADSFSHQSVVATDDRRAWRKLIENCDMTAAIKVTLLHVERVGVRRLVSGRAAAMT